MKPADNDNGADLPEPGAMVRRLSEATGLRFHAIDDMPDDMRARLEAEIDPEILERVFVNDRVPFEGASND